MKNIIVLLFVLVLFASAGCLNDSNSKINITEPPPATAAPVIGDTNANKIQAMPSATTAPATITSKPVSAAGLNPAHGQPGHRCDISVGAPLDSKPVQTTVQPQATTSSSTPVTIQPGNIQPPAAGKGLNPAHGQPGHRCDIAVGAPLNSAPAQ